MTNIHDGSSRLSGFMHDLVTEMKPDVSSWQEIDDILETAPYMSIWHDLSQLVQAEVTEARIDELERMDVKAASTTLRLYEAGTAVNIVTLHDIDERIKALQQDTSKESSK